MHFMYRVPQKNGVVAQRIYMKWFQDDRNMLDLQIFKRLHRELCTSRLFYASRRDTSTETYHRFHEMEQAVLCTIEEGPSKSLKAFTRVLGVSHFLAQPHAWNACWQDPHWWNGSCCSKFMRKITIQVRRRAFIRLTQQHLILTQRCISESTFLYKIRLFRFPRNFFTFLMYSFETLCIFQNLNGSIQSIWNFYNHGYLFCVSFLFGYPQNLRLLFSNHKTYWFFYI